MGFLDKVKSGIGDALESGKDVAQREQLKLHLRKLQKEEEEALAAFGNAAYTLWESGSLSMSSDLGAAAARIAEARAAIEAKKAEVAATGDDDDEDGAEPAAATATDATAGAEAEKPA